jgi:hypothetical protein
VIPSCTCSNGIAAVGKKNCPHITLQFVQVATTVGH